MDADVQKGPAPTNTINKIGNVPFFSALRKRAHAAFPAAGQHKGGPAGNAWSALPEAVRRTFPPTLRQECEKWATSSDAAPTPPAVSALPEPYVVASSAALFETLGIPADELLRGRKPKAALCTRLLAMGATAGTLRRILASALGMGAEPDGDEAPAMAAYIAHLAETLRRTLRHAAPAPTSSSSGEEDDDTGGTLVLTRVDFKEAIHHARTMAEAARLE